MNRTIKDATVKAFHYENLESLKAHVLAFVTAYNFAKHLKALRWRTPSQAIQEAWTKDPSPFKINPHQLIPRAPARTPNTGARLSAGGLLNEVEYRCLLLWVEPIPCLREPDTALGPERL